MNIFDGDKWLVTFGRDRNDRIGSQSKSLYFLRAGKLTSGYLNNYFSTSSYFDDSGTTSLNTISTDGNSSGSFCMVGSMSLGYDNSSTRYHLNRTSNIEHQYTKFSGKIANMRFFTKFLSEDETKTHINNFKSVGVSDPLLNYNFNTVSSGSFERLRYDVSTIQPTITSNSSGQINLFDFSQNNFSFSGNGFESNKEVIKVENYIFRILNPKFETFSNNNRIRINSFSNAENVEKFNSNFAPQYNLKNDQEFSPDNRVSVESSLIDALNEDIINIFSTLNILDNFLGNPELLYSPEYSNLRRLREIYFNRLENKISFKKFFEFFNWFDSTIGDIFSDLIPKNSKFIGSNLVIESHMLERPKFVYSNFNTYLDENLRITDGAEEINFNK